MGGCGCRPLTTPLQSPFYISSLFRQCEMDESAFETTVRTCRPLNLSPEHWTLQSLESLGIKRVSKGEGKSQEGKSGDHGCLDDQGCLGEYVLSVRHFKEAKETVEGSQSRPYAFLDLVVNSIVHDAAAQGWSCSNPWSPQFNVRVEGVEDCFDDSGLNYLGGLRWEAFSLGIKSDFQRKNIRLPCSYDVEPILRVAGALVGGYLSYKGSHACVSPLSDYMGSLHSWIAPVATLGKWMASSVAAGLGLFGGIEIARFVMEKIRCSYFEKTIQDHPLAQKAPYYFEAEGVFERAFNGALSERVNGIRDLENRTGMVYGGFPTPSHLDIMPI